MGNASINSIDNYFEFVFLSKSYAAFLMKKYGVEILRRYIDDPYKVFFLKKNETPVYFDEERQLHYVIVLAIPKTLLKKL